MFSLAGFYCVCSALFSPKKKFHLSRIQGCWGCHGNRQVIHSTNSIQYTISLSLLFPNVLILLTLDSIWWYWINFLLFLNWMLVAAVFLIWLDFDKVIYIGSILHNLPWHEGSTLCVMHQLFCYFFLLFSFAAVCGSLIIIKVDVTTPITRFKLFEFPRWILWCIWWMTRQKTIKLRTTKLRN